MGRHKVFNIHDLYPEDYCFDYEAFAADPEGYVFTQDDIAYANAMELERYEQTVPMSSYERRLLRQWVKSGHNPRENPGSKYICLSGSEPYDFLDVYRMDREIRRDMRGMGRSEQEAYLKEYMGWRDDDPEDVITWPDCELDADPFATDETGKETGMQKDQLSQSPDNETVAFMIPDATYIRNLEREIFHLWGFISQEGLRDDAKEYMDDIRNEPTPFEYASKL